MHCVAASNVREGGAVTVQKRTDVKVLENCYFQRVQVSMERSLAFPTSLMAITRVQSIKANVYQQYFFVKRFDKTNVQ